MPTTRQRNSESFSERLEKRDKLEQERQKKKDDFMERLIGVAASIADSIKPAPMPAMPESFYMPQVVKEEWLSTENEWLNVSNLDRVIYRVIYHPVEANTQEPTVILHYVGQADLEPMYLTKDMALKFIEWWKEKRKND